jgi:hypothetical protein
MPPLRNSICIYHGLMTEGRKIKDGKPRKGKANAAAGNLEETRVIRAAAAKVVYQAVPSYCL